jgi:hypothetical protein
MGHRRKWGINHFHQIYEVLPFSLPLCGPICLTAQPSPPRQWKMVSLAILCYHFVHRHARTNLNTYSFFMFSTNQQFIFNSFLLCCHLTEVSSQPSAIPGGNPPGDRQWAVGWWVAGLEPGTAGQQSGALPLSHNASHKSLPHIQSIQKWSYTCTEKEIKNLINQSITYSKSSFPDGSNSNNFSSLGLSWAEKLPFKAAKNDPRGFCYQKHLMICFGVFKTVVAQLRIGL